MLTTSPGRVTQSLLSVNESSATATDTRHEHHDEVYSRRCRWISADLMKVTVIKGTIENTVFVTRVCISVYKYIYIYIHIYLSVCVCVTVMCVCVCHLKCVHDLSSPNLPIAEFVG